jgi:hypothetical protein
LGHLLTETLDTNTDGGIWSIAEIAVGIMCANLPILRPLLVRYILNPVSSLRSSSAQTGPASIGMHQTSKNSRPNKSDSNFDSQASTQVFMSQNEVSQIDPKDELREIPRGWRAFIPHKESRFVGANTQGSVMDSQTFPEGDDLHGNYMNQHSSPIKEDVEWTGGQK